MQKIIIKSYVNEPDAQTVSRVLKVIEEGLVSDNGNCYCFGSTFYDNVQVFCNKTKTGYKFVVQNAIICDEKV